MSRRSVNPVTNLHTNDNTNAVQIVWASEWRTFWLRLTDFLPRTNDGISVRIRMMPIPSSVDLVAQSRWASTQKPYQQGSFPHFKVLRTATEPAWPLRLRHAWEKEERDYALPQVNCANTPPWVSTNMTFWSAFVSCNIDFCYSRNNNTFTRSISHKTWNAVKRCRKATRIQAVTSTIESFKDGQSLRLQDVISSGYAEYFRLSQPRVRVTRCFLALNFSVSQRSFFVFVVRCHTFLELFKRTTEPSLIDRTASSHQWSMYTGHSVSNHIKVIQVWLQSILRHKINIIEVVYSLEDRWSSPAQRPNYAGFYLQYTAYSSMPWITSLTLRDGISRVARHQSISNSSGSFPVSSGGHFVRRSACQFLNFQYEFQTALHTASRVHVRLTPIHNGPLITTVNRDL